jgi:hypothetical protein
MACGVWPNLRGNAALPVTREAGMQAGRAPVAFKRLVRPTAREHLERFTKVGYCALTGLAFLRGFWTQGVALGYHIAPRWGLARVRTEALKLPNSNLPRNGGQTRPVVRFDSRVALLYPSAKVMATGVAGAKASQRTYRRDAEPSCESVT